MAEMITPIPIFALKLAREIKNRSFCDPRKNKLIRFLTKGFIGKCKRFFCSHQNYEIIPKNHGQRPRTVEKTHLAKRLKRDKENNNLPMNSARQNVTQLFSTATE